MSNLTWWTPDGSWGIHGVDLAALPPKVYGALYKLHDMERAEEAFARSAPQWSPCETCQFGLHCGCRNDKHTYKLEACEYYATAYELEWLKRELAGEGRDE